MGGRLLAPTDGVAASAREGPPPVDVLQFRVWGMGFTLHGVAASTGERERQRKTERKTKKERKKEREGRKEK